ncbi:DUF982 domain-containing protein [Rhizobium sp.]
MEYWEKIVLLRLNGSAAKALSIRNSRDAAKVLLKAWPVKSGKSYRRAVLSCSAAIHGRVPQDLAQWAFIVAAMEAAISYEIIDPFDSEIAAICRELLEEDGPLEEVELATDDAEEIRPLFWWPKRQVSGPSAR